MQVISTIFFSLSIVFFSGDRFYRECITKRIAPNSMEANTEYLRVTELQSHTTYNNRIVDIHVYDELASNGHIKLMMILMLDSET